MKRLIPAILLVLTLVASGAIVLMVRDRDHLLKKAVRSELAQKQAEAEANVLRGENSRLLGELEKARMAATSATNSAAGASLTAGGDGSKVSGGFAVSGMAPLSEKDGAKVKGGFNMKALTEMMKDPQMKEVMKQQQIAMLDSQYAGLFSRFNFSEEEKADFKKLLGDRLTAEAELGLNLMDTDLTKEQRQALAKQSEEAKKAADDGIKNFLNSDADYAAYRNWEDTKAERTQLEMGRSLFSSSGEPLTPQQEEQLINSMHEASKIPSDLPDFSTASNFDPAQMASLDVDKMLAHQDRESEAVRQSAAQYLSPKQLETLGTMQKQWRMMTETGLKMSSAMFSQDAAGPAAK